MPATKRRRMIVNGAIMGKEGGERAGHLSSWKSVSRSPGTINIDHCGRAMPRALAQVLGSIAISGMA